MIINILFSLKAHENHCPPRSKCGYIWSMLFEMASQIPGSDKGQKTTQTMMMIITMTRKITAVSYGFPESYPLFLSGLAWSWTIRWIRCTRPSQVSSWLSPCLWSTESQSFWGCFIARIHFRYNLTSKAEKVKVTRWNVLKSLVHGGNLKIIFTHEIQIE